MSYRYVTDNSDNASSCSETDTSWISTSSEDTDDDIHEVFNGPEPKKIKKSNFVDKEFNETELNCDFVLKVNYKWTIKDFSKVCEEQKTGEKLDSPIFTVGSHEELKWRLQLYPRGNNDQNRNYVSLYLQLVSSKEPKIKVQYKCSILNNKKRNTNELQNMEYFVEGQRVGFRRLIKTDSLLRCANFLENDRLTLTCDIDAQLNKISANKIKVVNDLETLLDSGNYSDVTLEVENKKFKVHKYILAARSPVFAAMFKHDMKEKKQNIVEISDINYLVMKDVLRFTYTGEVANLDISAKDLLAAADKYAFEDLKVMCENALFKSLNVDNVVEILNFAELHSAVKLKEQALKFVVNNVKEVVTTSSFKTMGDSQSPLLAQVICMMASQQKS